MTLLLFQDIANQYKFHFVHLYSVQFFLIISLLFVLLILNFVDDYPTRKIINIIIKKLILLLFQNNVNIFLMLHVHDFELFLIEIEVVHDILNIHNNYFHEFSNLIKSINIFFLNKYLFFLPPRHIQQK
jgi:hypothetical protein